MRNLTRGDGRYRALAPGWYGIAPLELALGSRSPGRVAAALNYQQKIWVMTLLSG